mgnify:FL=1
MSDYTNELELFRLQVEMLDAWNTYPLPRTGAALEEWVEKYLKTYMDKLCYKYHGPRGHPNLDYQYQQQLLEEE